MYSLYKQIHPSTSIEHALSCHFFNRSAKSLVTAGKNIIRVFSLIPDVELPLKESYNDKKPPKMKLECLCSFQLFGNVMSMQAVSLSGSQRDALLLSFMDAKMCIVEYDPEAHDLKTLSLHYFEEEEIKGGWTQRHELPWMRVDPENRCAAMLAYGRNLVILPFRRETKADEADLALENNQTPAPAVIKAPVMSSYTVLLKDIDPKLENVIDIQFLHGYYEPTLLILYEPIKTFAGRIPVRMDTCCMVAVSLNIQQRVHPAIWSVPGLPFDCLQAVPVRKPLGGTLIFAVNSLIYLNQSMPPFGVALNSLTKSTTNFQLKEQEGLAITLECAQATSIANDRFVISLKSGELYVLSLLADSMRSIRGFHFDKAAASVLTTCICLIEDRYLFLGSRLGNSLLLRYTEKETGDAPVITLDEITPRETSKRRRHEDWGDWMASDVQDIRDEDELEVYGNQEATSAVFIASFTFEVCDSLLNVGPIGSVAMGEPAFLSEEYAGNTDPDVELVTTSGHGKNGAICVLQRSIRPQVVTTFELPGCLDMWTVVGAQFGGNPRDEDQSHAFLILSQSEATMILQTGQEINEVDNSGFYTGGSTVLAGNMGNYKFIVQVYSKGVRLLRGLDLLQQIPIDVGSPIVHASLSDPYLAMLTADGQLLMATLREARGSGKLAVSKPSVPSIPKPTKIFTYRDVSGLFTLTTEETLQGTTFKSDRRMKLEDDEDELLYGAPADIKLQLSAANAATGGGAAALPSQRWKKYIKEIKPNYWLFVVRENGNMDIYSLPDCKESYQVRRLGNGQRVLFDSLDSAQPTTQEQLLDPDVLEIAVVPLGHLGRKPLLLIRTPEELMVYQVFKYISGPNLKLRFKRLPQTILINEKKSRFAVKIENDIDPSRATRLRYFSNISNYNGVFVCGSNPHWLFLTARGELRTHPMPIDGRVNSFAAFHNVNCPQGFLYFNSKSELRICILPIHLSYDNPWPVRKVPLRCTPHMVTYHLESKTFCVVTSTYIQSNSFYRFNGEDKEFMAEEKDERFPLPLQQKFSVILFSPVSWEVIPNTKQDLHDWEHVTCLKTVQLSYEGTQSGLRGYIAVGTNYNYSEDITSKGRVLLYDVSEVVPEPGLPLTKNRFKPIYAKEQKGPITALCHVCGLLVTAMGQKIYVWQLKDDDLVGIAFIDSLIYIHQMLSVKNFILCADVYKSINLLRFQEEYRTLSLVSRDYKPCEVYAVELLIDSTQLGFLVTDSEMNIVQYVYKPDERASVGGQRLLRKSDFNIGQHVNSCFRIKCRLGNQALDFDLPPGAEKRHITMFATLDGALGFLLPLPEKTYRRLQMLQNILVHHIPHQAGLNPRQYRAYRSKNRLLGNPNRGVVDGDLVWMFLTLTSVEQQDLSKKIGSRVADILEDIADIERLTAHF